MQLKGRWFLPLIFYPCRRKSCAVCHSGLDPESSVFLDSRFRENDVLCCV